MKKSIFIVSMAVAMLSASCSEEDIQMNQTGTEAGTRTVTFNLSMESGDGMSVSTRSGENSGMERIDFKKYAVYVYWFHGDEGDNSGDYTFMGDEPEKVTDYVYTKTFEGEEVNKEHAYVFVAVPVDTFEDVIAKAKDVGPADSGGNGMGSFEENSATISSTSKLKNCYIPFSESDKSEDEISSVTLSANRNLEIFGDGATIVSGSPTGDITNTVLRRQFGIVRINANARDFTNKKITCKINTDYYRLYLSQMVKPGDASGVYEYYSSENSAESDDYGTTIYGGDYFSTTYKIVDAYDTPSIASFEWEKTVTESDLDEAGNINIYLPYTTVRETSDKSITDSEKTNYEHSYGKTLLGPSLTLTIVENEKTNEYAFNSSFPIFRNVVTAFNIKGDVLEIDWDNGTDGIDLDDDDWDGIQTAND